MELPFKVDLSGKVAVVTGGGGVICSELARALAACGAKVAVCSLHLEHAQKVVDEITADGGTSLPFSLNVTDKSSLVKAKDEILAAWGGIDILVNGAGGNNPRGTTTKEYLEPSDLDSGASSDLRTFFDLDEEGIRFVFDLNFLGTLLPTQVFSREMIGRPSPVILNVSSMNAFKPLTKIPAYSGAKAAVSNLTEWLAVHFSKVGIRVNAIAPGFFITSQNHDMLISPDGTYTARSQKILAHTPMNRFGKVSELVGATLWLVDANSSSFVNGIVVPIDGGFSAYSGV